MSALLEADSRDCPQQIYTSRNQHNALLTYSRRSMVNATDAGRWVTPANCQILITAGETINRDLFEGSLQRHVLRRIKQVAT